MFFGHIVQCAGTTENHAKVVAFSCVFFWYPAVMANVNERENLNEFTLAPAALDSRFLEKRR